jgi:hypothetical protein
LVVAASHARPIKDKLMAKKGGKKKAPSKPSLAGTVKVSAGKIVDEVEKVSEVVIAELREGFDTVSGKVSAVAKGAAGTVAETQVGHLLKSLTDEIEEMGESLIGVVSTRLGQLRGKAVEGAESITRAAKPAAKKAAVKKKVTERAAAKKPAVKKKVAKKAATKKVIPRKTATKKAPAKKAMTKKAGTRKTTTQKKSAVKKATTKKAAAKKD